LEGVIVVEGTPASDAGGGAIIRKSSGIRPDFKVMDKNESESGNCTLPVAPCRFESCSPTNHTLKNKHSYDTLNSKEVGALKM
jgi:hypothetical protein